MISKLLLLASAIFFIHSAYSVYEFLDLAKHATSSSPSPISYKGIPLDVKLEVLLALILGCGSQIIGAVGTLKPIRFAGAVSELQAKGDNPFARLESRPVFQDITAKRREYQKWHKNQKEKN